VFESLAGAAGAEVVAAQLLDELFVAMHDPPAALDARFGGEAPPALAHRLDENGSSSWSRRMGRRPFS